MVGGLTDMVLFCDSKLAAESLAKITGWASKNLDRSNAYAFGGTEWYTLSENLYRAHRATGDPRYRDFAAVWHYTEYWDIYARNGDLFGDRGNGRRTGVYHAYSHVNTLGGAAQAYLHTGDRRFLDTILHAHDTLVCAAVLSHRRLRARRAAPAPRRVDQEGRLLAQLVRDAVRLLRGLQALQVPAHDHRRRPVRRLDRATGL